MKKVKKKKLSKIVKARRKYRRDTLRKFLDDFESGKIPLYLQCEYRIRKAVKKFR